MRQPDRNEPAGLERPPRLAEALDRVTGERTSKLISWAEDPAVTAVVGSWPAHLVTDRASRLGLTADTSFDDIIRDYRSNTPAR